MKLEEAEKMAKELIILHCPEYSFKFDSAKRRHGLCSYRDKTIQLSRNSVETRTEDEVRNTIVHEIAHALTRSVHDSKWKSMHIKLGGDGKRCSPGSLEPGKYVVTCTHCNHSFTRYRKPRNRVACFDCCTIHNNGKFSDKYILEVQTNDI